MESIVVLYVYVLLLISLPFEIQRTQTSTYIVYLNRVQDRSVTICVRENYVTVQGRRRRHCRQNVQ